MTQVTFWLLYAFIGFLVASVVVKFWPAYDLAGTYGLFAIVMIFWPVFALFGIFYLPAILVGKWIKLIAGF